MAGIASPSDPQAVSASAGSAVPVKPGFTQNFIGTAAVNLATMGLGLVTGVLAARLLGPTGRGELAAILNWPLFLTTFSSLGVMTAAGYYCGRDSSHAGRTFGTAWIFLFLVSFPVMALGYWLVPWLMQAQSARVIEASRIMLLLVLVQMAGGLPYWVLQGLGKFKVWNLMRIQMPVLWLAVLVLTAYVFNGSADYVAYGYLAVMVVHNITWGVAMRWNVPGRYRFDFSHLPELLRYGLPTALTSVPQHLNQKFAQLLMVAFLPARILGFYVVAMIWSNAFSPLMSSVSQVIFPHLAAIHDRRRQTEIFQQALRSCVLVAGLLMVFLLAVTPAGFPLVFGSSFAPAVPAALVLVAAAAVSSLRNLASEALRGMGVPNYPMIAEIAGLGTAVSALALLLPRYQLMGAAIATFAGFLVALMTSVILVSRLTKSPIGLFFVPRRKDCVYMWNKLWAVREWKAALSPVES